MALHYYVNIYRTQMEQLKTGLNWLELPVELKQYSYKTGTHLQDMGDLLSIAMNLLAILTCSQSEGTYWHYTAVSYIYGEPKGNTLTV